MGNKPSLLQIRKDVISERDQSLEKYIPIFREILAQSGLSLEKIEAIINGDLPSMVQRLNNREVTSVQLVAIYGIRAATIGRKLSCITEDYFEYALQKAKQCDEIRSKTKKNNWTLNDEYDSEKYLPPLFGVPISIKDNIEMKGTRSTMGLTKRALKKHEEDSIFPICAKNSGMIPFIKSNVPQMCMTYDSTNFLWGNCLNPWNQKKSAGGSSGGEGALVAAKLSPIGIGNDLLGSIRIPAGFNGVVGLMSSTGRLPLFNTATFFTHSFAGMDLIKIVTGPLSQTVDAAALWMKAMTDESFYAGKHDPYIKLIPFDEKLYNETFTSKKRLKIGYFDSLEMIEPAPSMIRGVTQTVEFLKSEGHELVEISLPFERQLVLSPYHEVVGEGDMTTFIEAIQGEEFIDQYSNLKRVSGMNPYLLSFLKFLMRRLQPRVAMVLDAAAKINTHQYLQKTGRIYELRTQWINYWRKNQFDFVIGPGFGIPAADHGFAKECDLVAAYTYIWNALAMTSCSIPVTVTREDEQYYESHWEDDFTKAIKKTISTSAGLPVNVQIVGLPFSEERVLGLAKKIENHFQFRQKHPYPNL